MPATARGAPLFGFNEDWFAAGHAIKASNPFRPTVQRLHLSWPVVEAARGTYDWTAIDPVYRDMVAQGAPPIALVMGTPCWAVADRACGRLSVLYPIPPAHYTEWERFVRAVVRRYPRLAAVEVWNEPNLATFHYPRPHVAGYVEMLRRAHRATKSVRPRLPVLGGSLASTTTWRRARREGGFPRRPPSKYPYASFLRQMYRLGAASYMDALAFHPYPNFTPYLRQRRLTTGVRRGFRFGIRRDLRKQIATVRRIQRAYRASAPIWATETGICTTGPRERRVSAREQAVALALIYRTLRSMRARAILTHRLWDIRIPGRPANDLEHGCGLTDIQGQRKPAWNAMMRLRR